MTCTAGKAVLWYKVSLEAFSAVIRLIGELVEAFLKCLLDDGLADEFAMQLKEKFDVEGSPFGLHGAVKGVVHDIRRSAYYRLKALRFL